MASGSDFPDPSTFFERLFSSRNRENLSRIIPIMLSLANPQNSTSPDENSTNPDPQIARERLILINPYSQTMLVIESSNRDGDRDRDSSNSSDFDSWINDLMFRKEGQPPASKASMDSMPEVEIGEEGTECVICLEELEVGGIGKKMPCTHKFHGGCIERWLKIHGTCPVCRYKMPVEERDDKIDKEESQSQSQSGGRRRDVWLGFTIGEDDTSIRNGENNDFNDSSTNASPFVSRTDDHDHHHDDMEG